MGFTSFLNSFPYPDGVGLDAAYSRRSAWLAQPGVGLEVEARELTPKSPRSLTNLLLD